MATRLMRRLLWSLVACCLLSLAPLQSQADLIQAAPSFRLAQQANDDTGLYRTRVVLRTPTDRARLDTLGVVVLTTEDGGRKTDEKPTSALVLADEAALESLARLRYEPTDTVELALLVTANAPVAPWLAKGMTPLLNQAAQLKADADAGKTESSSVIRPSPSVALKSLSSAQVTALSNLTSVDDDGDGLTNTQESWWCTDPLNADSDGDGSSDGAEVVSLKDWMGNRRSGPPGTGKPFAGWPPTTTSAGNPGRSFPCQDDDRDSVPDLAERWELGLNMNWESSDRDQFDDGQELFGTTNCPGSGTACGYGSLPPASNDGSIVLFPEMPGWVKAPGNHPLVAGLPILGVDIVPDQNGATFTMQAITVITTDHQVGTNESHSYSTAKTEGTSTSAADTTTWNDWQEVSVTTPIVGTVQVGVNPEFAPVLGVVTEGTLDAKAERLAGNDGLGFGQFMADGWLERVCPITISPGLIDRPISDIPGVCNRTIVKGIGSVMDFGASKLAQFGDWITGTPTTTSGPSDVRPDAMPKTSYFYPGGTGCGGGNLKQSAPNEDSSDAIRQQACILFAKPTTQDRLTTGKGVLGAQDRISTASGTQYQYSPSTSTWTSRPTYPIAFPQSAPVPTTTSTRGSSRGGAHTTTNTQYEEHTVTNGHQMGTTEGWGSATAADSARSANLTFTYSIKNTGLDYARKICNVSFNIYLGTSTNPDITYDVGPDLGGDACFHNLKPGDSLTRVSHPITLNLSQVKAVDLGGPVRIVLANYTLSTEDYYTSDAMSRGVRVAMEDGMDDGDEAIDTYLIPTWADGDKVQDVVARYFPNTTDADGNITAIWTPEYRTDSPAWCVDRRLVGTAIWCKHALSTADWWNIYLNNLGDGTASLKDTTAAPNSTVFFRFNKDTDLDGYSDRSEQRLGTNPADPASHPSPQLIAGLHTKRAGNTVVGTLSFLNTGLYDAYGVEAVMIAPDDSVSITNNTVGGSGRVRAQRSVIVGSRVLPPTTAPATWTGTAKPAAGGYYTGAADLTYTFSVACSNPGGCDVGAGTWSLNWSDGTNSGSLPFGAGYASPSLVNVGAYGVQVSLLTGKVYNGNSFTVQANTPRDTFQYTINREPYTEPIVIVSFNDPQGNHRFVTPVRLTTPTDNLTGLGNQMLPDPGVEIVTTAAFSQGSNTTNLVVNNPTGTTLTNAHLFLEFVDPTGTVAHEATTTATLPAGPSVVPIPWNTTAFSPAYNASQDYIVMAFWTDYEGNILDTAGRPLSSFQADPKAESAMAAGDETWDFGTAQQGTLLQRQFTLASVGFMDLLTYLGTAQGVTVTGPTSRALAPGDFAPYTVTLNTQYLLTGPFSRTIPVRTSDPLNPSRTITIQGNITPLPADGQGGATLRPLDWTASIPGDHSQGEWVQYDHTLGPNPDTLHPVKVYDQGYTTLKGVGKYATDFGQGTASADMFGDGRDGAMPSSGNLDYDKGMGLGTATGTQGQTYITVTEQHYVNRIKAGDFVFIHQSRGIGAGNWELNKAAEDFGSNGTFALSKPLQYSYTTNGGDEKAQILRVPQYSSCSVTGTMTPRFGWQGGVGGIFAVACDTMTLNGSIVNNGSNGATSSSGSPQGGSGAGYRGGQGDAINNDNYGCGFAGEGTPGVRDCNNHNPNGNGGAAGTGRPEVGNFGTGGGGGNGTGGGTGTAGGRGLGGYEAGTADLTNMVFGGGGGGSNDNPGNSIGGGGAGGGIIVLLAKTLDIFGSIQANGGQGGGDKWGAGGGAGGSILIRSQNVNLASNSVQALGGAARSNGGSGGSGRIRIEYCESLTGSGTTNPPASTQKLSCYIAEQVESSPYTTTRLNLPESFTGGRTYKVQYGRRVLSDGITQPVSTLRLPAGPYANVVLDALLSNISGNVSFALDIGNKGTWDWQWSGPVSGAATLNTPDLSAAFNTYWASHSAPTSGTTDVPVRFSLNMAGQVILTNLQVKALPSRVRYVRLPARSLSNATLSLSVDKPILLKDDFSSGSASQWTPTHGAWQVTNGVYDVVGAGGAIDGWAYAGDTTWTDYSFKTHANMISGNGEFVFRSTGHWQNEYRLTIFSGRSTWLPNTLTLTHTKNSIGTTLMQVTLPSVIPDEADVRVDAVGSHFDVYLNERKWMSVDDPDPLLTGRIGLGVIWDWHAQFDNVEVLSLPSSYSTNAAASKSLSVGTEAIEPAHPDALVSTFNGEPLTLAADIGDDGSIDWTYTGSPSYPAGLTSGNLATAVNSYLAGKSGDIDVPIRVYIGPALSVSLSSFAGNPSAQPDLTLGAADIAFGAASPTEGDTVMVTATLHNNGTRDSGRLTASFFATPAGGSETYIGSAFVANVPAGSTAPAVLAWNTLGFTGATTVRVAVDPYNRLVETAETNNGASKPITILTRPDLAFPTISLSNAEPVVGETVGVTLTLRNGGQTTAGSETVALYRGNPGAPGSVELGSVPQAAQPGGTDRAVGFTWTPAAPGIYRLFGRADRDVQVNESNEGNNDVWLDVYVGFRGPISLDSGAAPADPAYTGSLGYGVVDTGETDLLLTCPVTGDGTYRLDPGGQVGYRFDHLLPGHFYHLDVTLMECDGAGRLETVKVDDYAITTTPVDLSDGQAHRLSLRLDPALYADRSINVVISAPGIDGAVVNAIALVDISYRYADAGGTNDPAYSSATGYGYLDGSPNTVWGTLPYQSVRVDQTDSEVRYRFDRLNAAKCYQANLTLWQPSGAARLQKVQFDSVDAGVTVNTGDYVLHQLVVDVPLTAYQSDGSVVVGIIRTNALTGAFVNEVAIEEKTTDCSLVSPTGTPTPTASPTATTALTATPTATASRTASPTPTATATVTAPAPLTPTATATASGTPTPTPTLPPPATASPTVTGTATATSTATATATATVTLTPPAAATATATATRTATATPTATAPSTSTPTRTATATPTATGATPRRRAMTDFDGDGKADVLWNYASSGQNVAWLMNGFTINWQLINSVPAGWQAVALGDFNGDGKTDVLWNSPTTGQNVVWLMNGFSITWQVVSAVPAGWKVVGVGDFNGDGKTDVLWNYETTGQNVMWLMNGFNITWQVVSAVPAGWKVVGVGDFDGDGKTDVLWNYSSTGQNVMWLVNGFTITWQMVSAVPAGWAPVAVGDFDGDGKTDVLWNYSASGQNVVWLVNGFAINWQLVSAVPAGWAPVAVGDFDNNGRTDVLWNYNASGQNVVWLMNGFSINWQVVSAVPAGWRPVSVGDFDGNGTTDVVWNYSSSGQNVVWLMNGFAINWQVVTSVPAGWAVVP